MPETGIKPITAFCYLVLSAIAHEAGQDAKDIAFRYGLNHIGVVPADVIDSVSKRQDPVEDVLPAAPVKCDVVWLQPPLKGLYDHEIPILVKHGLHADPLGLVDQPPVPGQDFLKCSHQYLFPILIYSLRQANALSLFYICPPGKYAQYILFSPPGKCTQFSCELLL